MVYLKTCNSNWSKLLNTPCSKTKSVNWDSTWHARQYHRMAPTIPGPGLGILVSWRIDRRKLTIVRDSGRHSKEIANAGLDRIFGNTSSRLTSTAAPSVLQGDGRTWPIELRHTAGIRVVTLIHRWHDRWLLPVSREVLQKSASVSSTKSHVNRTYDITSKPPATVEWEYQQDRNLMYHCFVFLFLILSNNDIQYTSKY